MCRDLNLFSHAIVAIDGSKFKAVNGRDRNFTAGKIDALKRVIAVLGITRTMKAMRLMGA
jgi:hypothetical protein